MLYDVQTSCNEIKKEEEGILMNTLINFSPHQP
jgi:hypothetical protein